MTVRLEMLMVLVTAMLLVLLERAQIATAQAGRH